MNIVQKGIRVRLYPTEERVTLIDKTFGCCRFVYNQINHKLSRKLVEEYLRKILKFFVIYY